MNKSKRFTCILNNLFINLYVITPLKPNKGIDSSRRPRVSFLDKPGRAL
jgi:hypothetical protein